MSVETVSLLRRLLNRDPAELDTALRLARGEQVGDEELRPLQRAGILRRRRGSKRPRLIPALLAPLLALEESIAGSGRRLLLALQARLRGSETADERESILEALYEELEAQRQRLREEPGPDAESLIPVLREIRSTLESLDPQQADPALVMAAAGLAAELIELIGRGLAPRRRPRVERPELPKASPAQLAALLPPAPTLPRLLKVPAPIELAAALRGERPPQAQSQAPQALPKQSDRREEVSEALSSPDVISALYRDIDRSGAFERHAALAVLGRRALSEASVELGDQMQMIGEVRVSELKREQQELFDTKPELREVA